MALTPDLLGALQDAGFAGLCIVLIWWVFRTTGEREKSFRERESSFIKLMETYAMQQKETNEEMRHVAEVLQLQTARIEDMQKTVAAWAERRLRDLGKRED